MRKIYLKWQYKSLYLKIRDFKGHDCGHQMMMHISSRYSGLVFSFNKTADKLAKIDPDLPTFRYSTL